MSEDVRTSGAHNEKNRLEKILLLVRKEANQLKSEAESPDEVLFLRRDNYVREILKRSSFVDIDIRRIFSIINA
jgi:hypothetical protein